MCCVNKNIFEEFLNKPDFLNLFSRLNPKPVVYLLVWVLTRKCRTGRPTSFPAVGGCASPSHAPSSSNRPSSCSTSPPTIWIWTQSSGKDPKVEFNLNFKTSLFFLIRSSFNSISMIHSTLVFLIRSSFNSIHMKHSTLKLNLNCGQIFYSSLGF